MTAARSNLNRRDFLGTSLAGGALATTLTAIAGRADGADPAEHLMAAYAGAMSCAPGEVLSLHASTSAARYGVKVERVGAERKLVWSQAGIFGARHATPADAAERGCHWPVALQLPIPRDWASGVYRIELRGEGQDAALTTETFFILRAAEPGKQGRILFQLSTNTYQAYNLWGGTCLYSGPDHARVSFDRPWIITPPVRTAVKGFYNPNTACYQTWDEPLIRWAEQSGYALEYCANLDLELQPDLLKHYRLVLSVGHDEYWSAGMRDNLEAFIHAGGNAAFLSGNSVCWQTRVQDKGRTLVCYKMSHQRDPVFAGDDKGALTTLWSDPLVDRPENRLTGVGFAFGGYNGFFGEHTSGVGAGEYVVHRPKHWLFAGTGLESGERFGSLSVPGPQPGVAGYECDGCEYVMRGGLPEPTGRDGTPKDFEILAIAPARWSAVDGSIEWARAIRRALKPDASVGDDLQACAGAAVMGAYQQGGTVVTVGSCGWSYGLEAGDHVVDRIVRNLFDRLSV